MRSSEIGSRYAKALYELSSETKQQDAVFEQLRSLNEALQGDSAIKAFLSSPLIQPSQKEEAFSKAFQATKLSDLVKSFLLLLARKQRLDVFADVVTAFQSIADKEHGVVRGVVRSTTVLAPEERKRIEQTVNKVTHKQSLLTYKEDPQLLGGLVAEVGSYTFDDSLASHLKRLNEQLTRRTV